MTSTSDHDRSINETELAEAARRFGLVRHDDGVYRVAGGEGDDNN